MKKMFFVSLFALVLVAGCSTQKFNINEGSNSNSITDNSNFVVLGIGQTDKINAAAICKGADKVVSVEAKQTFLNILLNFITFNIYSPRNYTVTCKS